MITIYDWFGYEMPIKERYRLIKEAGFDGVLLWWSNDFGRDCFGLNDYRNGPQIAREAGLYIENIHTPVQNQNKLWLDNLDGEALHLHDNGGSYAQHQLPFDGTIDWSSTMKTIGETNYSGATALEPMNWGYKELPVEMFLHEAFERAKKLEKLRMSFKSGM